METPSAALRQSATETRSPVTNSAATSAEDCRSTALSLSSRLEGRTRQRRLLKPHSSSVLTTLAPIKPLDPVIRILSFASAVFAFSNAGGICKSALQKTLNPLKSIASYDGSAVKFASANKVEL